jgi:hypothetical protein
VVHKKPAWLSLRPGAKHAITTELDKLNDRFVQHDPSGAYFPLSQVKGFTVSTELIAAEEGKHRHTHLNQKGIV